MTVVLGMAQAKQTWFSYVCNANVQMIHLRINTITRLLKRQQVCERVVFTRWWRPEIKWNIYRQILIVIVLNCQI